VLIWQTLDDSRKALNDVLGTLEKQGNALATSVQVAKDQQRVLGQQLQSMQSLQDVAEQHWKSATAQPTILVLTIGYLNPSGVGIYSAMMPFGELSVGYAKSELPKEIPISIRNIGTAVLKKPKVVAIVDAPAELECVSLRLYSPGGREGACSYVNVDLPDLRPTPEPQPLNLAKVAARDSDLNFFVFYKYPTGTTKVKVHIFISAENLTAASYSADVHLEKSN